MLRIDGGIAVISAKCIHFGDMDFTFPALRESVPNTAKSGGTIEGENRRDKSTTDCKRRGAEQEMG